MHRQLAKVVAFDLDKTFYTSGDAANPRIVVQNISNQSLDHLQVEFEAYTYPWIAPAADDKLGWKTVATDSLSLAPGATKEFHLERAAVVHAEGKQNNIYYSAVIRDAKEPDRIYDLAFRAFCNHRASDESSVEGLPGPLPLPRYRGRSCVGTLSSVLSSRVCLGHDQLRPEAHPVPLRPSALVHT